MSKFTNTSTYFKKNSTYKLNIGKKIPQNEIKKNKKSTNNENNSSSKISESEFKKLMKEDNKLKQTQNKTVKEIKISSYLDKITDSNTINQLLEQEIKGDDLINKIKYDNISGTEFLSSILKKYNNPKNLTWVEKEEYGEVLHLLLEDNLKEQLICLLLVQNYYIQNNMPKINHRNKDVYYIKLLFLLMFTNDIIQESVYWEWKKILPVIVDLDKDTKNNLAIHTNDFFDILKMTLPEEYEQEDNKEEDNKEEDNKEEDNKEEDNEEEDNEEEDNEDFNLDDL